MPASAHTKDEKQFWKLVWPTLKTGGWRYEEEGAAARNGGGSDQSDEGRSTAAPGGNSRRTSSRNRKRSSSSSTSSRSSNSSNSSSPAAASSPRDPSAAAAGGAAAGTTPPKKPVFVPPVVGVASEALEEAMRRSAPADGSLEEERRSRLVGVTAVIELLQQVPGFPGTTTGIVNFDAVAAAARGVMVRTPSPPTLVENGGAAGTPAGEPQLRGENAVGSPSSRSRSSSISSSDEAVIEPPSGIWSSAAGNSSSQQQVPSSVGSGGAGSADGNSDASATSATRRGRVIKKPVRLEEQDPGRQTLPGRNGRADAPAKLAGRAAAEGPAQPGAAVGDAAGLPSASGKAGGQANFEGRAAVEESTAAVVAGAERCVARLGTAANGDSVETGTRNAVQVTGSSSGKGGVEADKSSSSNSAGVAPSSSSVAGCAVRPAMLSERRTSGSGPAPQGDAEEADGADSAAGESSKKGKGSVRERDRLVVPDPPPERPFGGLGPAPDEAIKEYKRAFDDVVWPALAEEFGWTKVYGPRMHDVYYLPMGVARGQNGARCRVDYYDSNRQVLIHMAEHEEKYRGLLERAWAAAVLKPRAIGRKSAASGGSKRKKRWTEQPRRKSTMMKNEYPKKVSLVGTAYQVDPLNLPIAVSSEEYVPPEDVQFEQVWDPSVLLPSSEGAAAPPDPDMPVEELAGSVSHDKCLEILYRCGGDHDDARKMLKTLQRSWRARHHLAGVTAKETVKAREIVKTETAARLEGAPQQSSSSAATGGSGKGSKGGGSCPIVEGSTTVTATTTRSAVAWGGGAAAVASRSSGSTGSSSSSGGSSSGGGGSSSSRGGRFQGSRTGTEVQDAYWHRPFKSLAGGKHALDRQVEGGVSLSPPGVRGRERFLADQDLSKPWTPQEADTFTRALLEEGSKNFYAVQKALPGRQVCELVDRYYGGWKQTPPYKILKQSISLSKKQSACGRCHSGGDLICCDGCDAVYHPECVGISVVPEGDWFCPACVSAKKNESQRTAGGSALVPGPGAKPAVAGTNNEVPANAGRSKRARPTATVETAATAAVVASSKKPRAVVGDKAGGVASGSKPEQAPARGAGGRQARPASHMRMERVPIQLGSARGAASSVAGVSQKVSSEASAPAPAGSAATKTSASPAAPHSEKDSRVSDQLGKRPQVPQAKEQHPGKRTARGARVAAAAPAKNAAKAAPPELSAGSAVGGSGSGTAVGKGAQKAATPVRSEVLQDKPGGEWDCRGCTYRNRPEHRRCRQCEGLRLAGAEMMRKVPPPPPIASLSSPSAVPVPVAAPAPAPLVDSKSFAVKRQSVPAPCLGEIEPVFSRPASAVANAAAAAALAAAAAGARAATAPRGLIEPIFSRPASAVANAAAAAAAAAAGAASARAARAPAQPAPAPSRLWCCRACSTFNRRSAVYCVSCRTRKEFKDVEEGKPDWWCCRKCSRFNNRRQDGNTCRVCSAVDQDDAAEQEEEMISVGDEISMPGMAAAAERFVQL